jgi:hypothetical protein
MFYPIFWSAQTNSISIKVKKLLSVGQKKSQIGFCDGAWNIYPSNKSESKARILKYFIFQNLVLMFNIESISCQLFYDLFS